MQRLTYKQAFDLITEAYIKDEIKPFRSAFCFCGTLNSNYTSYWTGHNSKNDGYHYLGHEFQILETALFEGITEITGITCYSSEGERANELHRDYENALFNGMVRALDALKAIHKEFGEIIDETPAFTKRQLPATV